MTAMTPDEQQVSRDIFEGAEVREVPADWSPPFQPWVDTQPNPVIAWWAWQRPDTFIPVYQR